MYATKEIIENMFCKGCLDMTMAEVTKRAGGNSTFANELLDAVIHKLAHRKTDLPTDNADARYFIGQYQSSKGRFFIKQDIKTGDKWIYSAFEETSVNSGNVTYYEL